MPTVSAKVSKKELDAICEYANACGESVSNLIRKLVLRDATGELFYGDVKEYECFVSIPDNISGKEEEKIVLGSINKIRRILGLSEQQQL